MKFGKWFKDNKVLALIVLVVLVGGVWWWSRGPDMTSLVPHFVRDGKEVVVGGALDTQALIGGEYLIDGMFIDVVATNSGTEVDIENAAPVVAGAVPNAFSMSLVGPVAANPSVTIVKNGGSEMWTGDVMLFADNPGLIDGDGVCDEPTRFSVAVDGTFYESAPNPNAPISASGFVDVLICPDECTDGTDDATCSVITEGKRCVITTSTATLTWDSSCCVDPRFHWDSVFSTCVENTCTDGTLHDECSTINIGQFCNTGGQPVADCQTCGCSGLIDGMGNPYTCNLGTGICEPPSYMGSFSVSVTRG